MIQKTCIWAAALACILLACSLAAPCAYAQKELSPQEEKILEQMQEEQGAGEVTGGDYSPAEHWLATAWQAALILATLCLLAFGAWKLSRLVVSLFSPASRGQEKRSWSRIQVPEESALASLDLDEAQGQEVRARLRDISQAGACLEIEDYPRTLRPGQDLRLSIQLPNRANVSFSHLSGQVRWAENNKIGIQFNQLIQFSMEVLESMFLSADKTMHGARR